MKVFALKDFYKEARKEGVADSDLCAVVRRTEVGLVDAALGKFLIKQRIARDGQGRSKGLRVIVFYKNETISVFLHLFAKNAKANLTSDELAVYRALVGVLDRLSEQQRAKLVRTGKWIELDYEEDRDELSKRSAAVGSSGHEGSSRGRRGR